MESILIYIRDLQYCSEIPPPNIEWWESKEDTQLSVVRTEFHFSALHYGDYVLWGAELWFVVCGCVLVR